MMDKKQNFRLIASSAINRPRTGTSRKDNQQHQRIEPAITVHSTLKKYSSSQASATSKCPRSRYRPTQNMLYTFVGLTFTLLTANLQLPEPIEAISVPPHEFNRLILPCYTGQRIPVFDQRQQPQQQFPQPNSAYNGVSNQQQTSGFGGIAGQATNTGFGTSYGNDLGPITQQMILGQRQPRAQTIDNFIALVSKIESQNPRLSANLDSFIRTLLERFHYDNVYYDIRSRQTIDLTATDTRRLDIVRALLSPSDQSQRSRDGSSQFPEMALDDDEKCSMYFMLSHHIEKQPLGYYQQPLASQPVQPFQTAQMLNQNQGLGLVPGQRPGVNDRAYQGPSPGYGTPAMGPAVNGQPMNGGYMGTNPFGANTQFGTPAQSYRNDFGRPGQPSRPSSSLASVTNPGQALRALEFGIVSLGEQNAGAVEMSRVLMGILAALQPPQQIRQVASAVFPNVQSVSNALRGELELDPLYAVTLGDLWAVSAELPSKIQQQQFKQVILGVDGQWNNSMCPTQFTLERSDKIRVTNAELYGGLDGLNLGRAIRQMMGTRLSFKLSDLLRMYYSRDGLRPQLPNVGVCQRGTSLAQFATELRQQAEGYFRVYMMRSVLGEVELSEHFESMRNTFESILARAPVPDLMCNSYDYESGGASSGINRGNERCEVAKADVVVIMDTSPQANRPFVGQCLARLTPKLNMWKYGTTLTILTNQLDTSGTNARPGGAGYTFNEILANTSNPAQIGCSLLYDDDAIRYQGAPVQDLAKLMAMFEQTLVNLESNEFMRITTSNGYPRPSSSMYSSGYNPSSGYSQSLMLPTGAYQSLRNGLSGGATGWAMGGPRNTGPAKVILWFNYMPMGARFTSAPSNVPTGLSFGNYDNSQGSFTEKKRLLRENFRGASILAVGPNRADLAPFVYNAERDIFSQVPPGGASIDGIDQFGYSDNRGQSPIDGDAEQLASRLVARICETPATFEYPQCYQTLSESVVSTGYITPGHTQHWMMSPKTMFASRLVRMTFRVEGGRLRVCFGRSERPDETARASGLPMGGGGSSAAGSSTAQISSNAQNNPYAGGVSGPNVLGPNLASGNVAPTSYQTFSSGSSSELGWSHGVCKDVGLNQEIDFNVDDPCVTDTIGECRPFYFSVSELSAQPGETDPNWVCRDEGCRRLDQAKFVFTHSGVSCNLSLAPYSFPRIVYWILLTIFILFILIVAMLCHRRHKQSKSQ